MTHRLYGKSAATEDFCRFLSACYCEPTAAFGEERMFESLQVAAASIDPELAESARKLGAEFGAQDLQELLVDYAALFIGPGQPRAMPYASFWLTDDQSKRHEATMAVLNFYEEGGFDVSDEIHELPDHVAVEFEFLYALNFSRNSAQGGGAESASAADALYRRYVVEHLGRWIVPFAAAVRVGAATAFYRELAELTVKFLRLEADRACPN